MITSVLNNRFSDFWPKFSDVPHPPLRLCILVIAKICDPTLIRQNIHVCLRHIRTCMYVCDCMFATHFLSFSLFCQAIVEYLNYNLYVYSSLYRISRMGGGPRSNGGGTFLHLRNQKFRAF